MIRVSKTPLLNDIPLPWAGSLLGWSVARRGPEGDPRSTDGFWLEELRADTWEAWALGDGDSLNNQIAAGAGLGWKKQLPALL